MIGQDTIRRLMTGDDRGVSEVIGAILVFGLVVALMAVLQTQAIPSANEEVEVEHNQRVQSDLSGLQASISRASTRGSGETTRVELGTTYPPRMLFYNPAPVQGRFTTSDSGPVELSNVEAINPETRDYLNPSAPVGGAGAIESRSVVYSANYNEFSNTPNIILENSLQVNRYTDNDPVVKDSGEFISARDISLTTMTGDFERSSSGVINVRTKSVSGPAQTVPVRAPSSGGNLEITIPTNIPESVWVQEILAQEIDDDDASGIGPEPGESCGDLEPSAVVADNDRYVVDCSYDGTGTPNELTITLQRDDPSGRVVYNLDMARVGIGDSFDRPDPHYITVKEPRTKAFPAGSDVTLTAEVRDRYNNPVSGEDVEFTWPNPGGSPVTLGTAVTNEDGQATFTFTPPAGFSGSQSVTATATGISGVPAAQQEAEFNVQLGGIGPVTIESISKDGATESVTFELRNRGSTEIDVEEIQLSYFSNAEVVIGGGGGAVSVTTLNDGIDEIDSVSMDTTTNLGPGVGVEGEQPAIAQVGTINAGSTEPLIIYMDGDFDTDEFILVEVTVFYEGGYKETYSAHLPDGST